LKITVPRTIRGSKKNLSGKEQLEPLVQWMLQVLHGTINPNKTCLLLIVHGSKCAHLTVLDRHSL